MKKIIQEKLNNPSITFVLGMASFVLFVMSQMISSSVETSKWITLIRVAVITASVACYLLCWLSSESIEDYRRQIAWVNICNLVFHVLFCMVAFKTAWGMRYYSVLYMEMTWIIAILAILWGSRRVLISSLNSLKNKDTRFYVISATVIAIILIVLSYDVGGPHFVWDARSFYAWFSPINETDAFDISKFFLFSHIDLTYFYSLFLLWQITDSLTAGYFIYGAICLTVISFSIVFILKKTLYHKGRLFILLASAACLFSPYVCGMSTYNTYDFALCCFTPLLILFAINEEWIYFILTAFYISQMKETGIIYVGSVCAGVILMEMICEKRSFCSVVFRKRTVAQLLVATNFVVFFVVYSHWWKDSAESGGGFGFDLSHIKTVLKMFLVLNYEWLIITSLIIFTICALIKRKKIVKYTIIYSSTAVFPLVFYTLYITGTYPRYTNAFPVCMLMLLVTAMSYFDISQYVNIGVLIGLSGLMIAASFVSFDPVSEAVFTTENIGNSKIYFSRANFDFGGDPCVYNRQYYGMDIVLDKALRKAIDSGVELIAISNGDNKSTWAIDGGLYAYDESIEKRVFTEFWNKKRDTRDPIYKWEYYDDPNYVRMDIRYIFPSDNIIESLQQGESFIYIYLPSQNGDRESIVRENFDVLEEGTFTSRGWVISYIIGLSK